MGVSDIVFLETLIKGTVQLKKQFKECCLSEVPEGVEVLCYKGKIYDREKFVLTEMKRLQTAKYSHIQHALADAKRELEKGGENAELVAAYISAYLRVLSEKKKPLFYIDDGL